MMEIAMDTLPSLRVHGRRIQRVAVGGCVVLRPFLMTASPPPAADERRKLFGELRWVAEVRGYKPGWVDHTWKAKHGEFPPQSWHEEVQPTRAGVETVKLIALLQNEYRRALAEEVDIFAPLPKRGRRRRRR
jgi:hypothetical protein